MTTQETAWQAVATRNVNGYLAPALTADGVLLKGREVLLIRRARPPHEGAWALPGGHVDVGESTEHAAVRELAEETGLKGTIVDLLGVYSDPGRDPRGHYVTVAYVCRVSGIIGFTDPDSDAGEARWFAIDDPPALAFDHARIVRDARAWLDRAGNLERLADNDVGMCA